MQTPGWLIAWTLVLALVCGCAGAFTTVRSRYLEGWVVGEPAQVGMDAARLDAVATRLNNERRHGIDSMLVVRRGRLVAEHYWNRQTAADLHDLRSATKSITSLLVGIAHDHGTLPDLHAPIWPAFAADYPNAVTGRPAVTLEHLLTMRSGLTCNDRDRRSPGHEDRMYRARDWTAFFLALPHADAPGDRTQYCTGNIIAIGRVLTHATGQSIPEFAADHLFGPLGIHAYAWRTFDGGQQTDTGGHLWLRPRAMAKIGQLVVQRGVWDDEDIVSGDWIDLSTAVHTRFSADQRPYGYLWWRAKTRRDTPSGTRWLDIIFASGNGGQYIFIIPELDLVVVFTGRNYNSPAANRPLTILGEDIIPAVLAPPATPTTETRDGSSGS